MTAVVTAFASASALVACTADPAMSAFQNPRPWQSEGSAVYEKLDYSVSVYDTKKGATEDKRVLIASGDLGFVLEYGEQTSLGGEATLDMSFSVKYNDNAPEKDIGITDTIVSKTTLRTDSLETLSMQKTVTLGERAGETNRSYSITAENGKATRTMYGNTSTLKINGKYWDNETMYYLARATDIKKSATTNFYMTGLFDCFEKDEYSQLTMSAAANDSLTKLEFDEWIKDYVITKEQEDAEKEEEKNDQETKAAKSDEATGGETAEDTPYTVPCYSVAILMATTESGPAHFAYYSERPIEVDGIRHKKVPLKITYAVYDGNSMALYYEYILTSLSFKK